MPYLLLHGFTGSPAGWDQVVDALGAESKILRPALVGHGASELSERPDSFESEVDRIAEMIRARAEAAVWLCGYSMGGRVALGLAVRHPALVARLTLIGASAGLREGSSERTARAELEIRWIDLLRKDGLKPFIDAWEKLPLFESQERLPARTRERQRNQRMQHRAEGLATALELLGLAQMPCYAPDLERLKMPVQLIVGEQDEKFRFIAAEMKRAIPNPELHLLPEAGHNLPLERPNAIATLLQRGSES